MKSKNKSDIIVFKTPETEGPIMFREFIAIELRGYRNLQINNIEGTDYIEIKGATEKEAKRIRTRITDLGASVMKS